MCVELGERHAVAEVATDDDDIRPGGFIAGPTQFALADAALWFLVFGALGRIEPMALTSELSIRYLRPAIGPTLHARADLAAISRRSVVGSVTRVDGRRRQADRRRPGHLRPAAGDVIITDPDDERLADFVDLADPAARRRRERERAVHRRGSDRRRPTDRVAASGPFDPRHAQAPRRRRGAAWRRRGRRSSSPTRRSSPAPSGSTSTAA